MTTTTLAGRAGSGRSVRKRQGGTQTATARRSATLLKLLTDPTRLQSLQILARGERHVGALCDELSLSQATVSHHLGLLRHGGLVMCRRQGKNSLYALTADGRMMADFVDALVRSVPFRR